MKYPRLPEHLDLRKKLKQNDIVQIRREFKARKGTMSNRRLMLVLADKYGVSWSTVYYWVDDRYRARQRSNSAKAHSKKVDIEDYVRHREREIQNRAERMNRYEPLKLWHAEVSARNEKRCKRKTVNGIVLK